MKKINKKNLSENDIIYNYFSKLHFNKSETFKFYNDGAIIKSKKNNDLVVTSDSIIENIDFFENDCPESIAQKIVTVNLSDLSSMGAIPYSYTLSINFPKGTNNIWLQKFTKNRDRFWMRF